MVKILEADNVFVNVQSHCVLQLRYIEISITI